MYLSKKWFSGLLIAAVVGLIIVVSTKFVPAILLPFGGSKSPSNSTLSPDSNASPVAELRSVPLETTRNQGQGSIRELQSEETVPRPVTLSIYENSSYGTRIQYPSNWQIVEGGHDDDGIIEIAGFLSPFEDRFDTYHERLWISVDNLPKNLTLKEYSNEVIDLKNKSLQDFSLSDHDIDSIILAGHPAYRFINSWSLDDGKTMKEMEIGTKIGNKIYYVTYYAEEERFPYFLPVIQDMINSFEIER